MPSDAKVYWRDVTKQVMGLFDGGGGGMKAAATLVGKAVGKAAAEAAAAAGEGTARQEAARTTAARLAEQQTMAELRAAMCKPCAKQHLYQVGEYQLQDALLAEPFEVICFYSSYCRRAHGMAQTTAR